MRDSWRRAALNDIVRWIQEEDGSIAIYDATNVERRVRETLYTYCNDNGFKLFFVESECNDPEQIQTTVREASCVFALLFQRSLLGKTPWSGLHWPGKGSS